MRLIKHFEEMNPSSETLTKETEDKEGIFRVEKIMLRRIRNTMTEYLVKWEGKELMGICTINIPAYSYIYVFRLFITIFHLGAR